MTIKEALLKQIQQNTEEMEAGNMHELDKLVMMVDTQRALIYVLQMEISELKEVVNHQKVYID